MTITQANKLASLFVDEFQKPFIFTKTQLQIFYDIITKKNRRLAFIAPTQYGKKISDDTPILTSIGWKKHGNIEIGDYVFSSQGKKVKVIGIANNGIDIDKEIEFTNGEKIKCHRKHEWIVKTKYDLRRKYDFQIVETEEIERTLKIKHYSVPQIKPINFERKTELPLDPYFLGAWLGDGPESKCAITIQENDDDIIKAIPYKVSAKCKHKITGVITYYFSHQNIIQKIRKLNLFKNKHIPDIYKFSSIEDRKNLIAGLIDTDGYVSKEKRENNWNNGRIVITNINKRLIDDIAEIIHSLGLKTTIIELQPQLSSSGIQGKHKVYVIGFQPFVDFPTKLKRKKINIRENNRCIRIKNIKTITPVNGKCIEVEGGEYLVGKKLIPTHNSTCIALATIIRTVILPEKFTIIAPTKAKTQIIMGCIIEHLFDNELFCSQLKIEGGRIEQLKRERNKEHLTFKRGGEIMCLTADARNQKKLGSALLGWGSSNILIDDSPLLSDELYLYVKRMVGGIKNNFIFETGNPLNRNHFFKTMTTNKRYKKIWIDYKVALKENRIPQDFIDEMLEANNPKFFDIFYGCKFPESNFIDSEGYQSLWSYEQIERCLRRIDKPSQNNKIIGGDVGRGGAESACALKTDNYIRFLFHDRNPDLMATTGNFKKAISDEKVDNANVYLDDIGVGGGVVARLKEQDCKVNGVNVGLSCEDEDKKFANKRAEIYFRLFEFTKQNHIEPVDKLAEQLSEIRWKFNSSGKIQIEPKEHLRLRGIESPDLVDACALCFTEKVIEADNTVQPRLKTNKITGYPIDDDDDEFNISEFLNIPSPMVNGRRI